SIGGSNRISAFPQVLRAPAQCGHLNLNWRDWDVQANHWDHGESDLHYLSPCSPCPPWWLWANSYCSDADLSRAFPWQRGMLGERLSSESHADALETNQFRPQESRAGLFWPNPCSTEVLEEKLSPLVLQSDY